jgi:hypothetical protein
VADSARLPGSHAWPDLPAPYHRWFRQVDAAITGGGTTNTSLAAVTQRVADLEAAAGQQPVLSVFNRTGVVQAQRADYAAWFQPKDATLTAFAALTIAADSLTIGTGADAFSQVTFAANTFPAKASTGALSAKPITDFALTLLDDASAADARTTLGAQPLDSTLTGLSGAAPALPALGNYADDTAAAAGGVAVGGLYRNGSVLMIRVT